MKSTCGQFGILVSSILMLQGTAVAQLPELNLKGWYGHFIGMETRNHHFGMSSRGKGQLSPIGKRGDPVTSQICPTITFLVEETMPDGRVVARQVQEDSLVTESEASTEFEAVSFTGKVTGDAAFSVNIENDRGVISIGGRLTDPGTLVKNPLKFVIRVSFPSAYKHVSVEKRTEKEFLRRVKDDRLDLVYTDKKRAKLETAEVVDAKSEEVNGVGIASFALEMDAFQGKKFLFTASGASKMKLWSRAVEPLHEGFSVNWESDPAQDAEGAARLIMEVK